MKKIYSIVLMAAALLIGTNVKAETTTHKVGTAEELVSAFENAANGDVIQLKNNIEIPGFTKKGTANSAKTKYYPFNIPFITIDGKNLTLDLNGDTIRDEAGKYRKIIFYLKKGHLTIESSTGNGAVICLNQNDGVNTTNPNKGNPSGGIPVYVSGNNDSIPSSTEYQWTSKLIVKKNVTLQGNAAGAYIDGTANTCTLNGEYKNGLSAKNGYDALSTDVKPVAAITGNNGKACAFNAYIELQNGSLVKGNNYGAQISGNVKYVPNKDHREFIPTISIAEGAVATTLNNVAEFSVGAYSSGFGRLDIHGTVHGSTGVYSKSGEVNIGGGAYVYSDNPTVIDPVSGTRSSVTAGGSAIIFDSNAAYGGNIEINITDGATIGADPEGNTPGGGYTITGVSEPTVGNQLKGMDIQGGTIVASSTSEGLMNTDVLKEAVKDGGATFVVDGATIKADAVDMTDLNELLTLAGVSTIIEQTADGEYVFQKANGATVVENVDLNNVPTGTTHVALNGSEQTLSKDVELVYLSLKRDAANHISKVIIPAGFSLKVGSIVVDETSVIDVQLGGKLIITGKNGLVANKTSNIKIAAKEGQMGIFMLSPDAEANKNPGATVTLETKAHAIDAATDQFAYQRIGVPAAKGMKASEITYSPKSANIALKYWDADKQDWAWVPSLATVLEPFRGYSLTNLATAEGTLYSFPCQLMGNTDANLLLKGKWTSFANSYMANVDLFALLADILAADAGASASVYVYDAAGEGGNHWPVIDYGDLEEWKAGHIDAPLFTALEPMQGFIFRNIDETIDANAVISYKNDVWNPVFAPAAIAARRGAKANNVTRVKITITGENGQASTMTLRQGEDFSAAFDNGYDAHAMIGLNPVTIFANTEMGEMASVASNNVEGTTLSIASQEESNFTMTFSNLNGEQLAIRDNLTGSVINMVEGAEYRFAVAENSSADRFEIVAIHNAPTAVETVANIEGVKAVYTVLGQYVGTTDNWNVLPAGIYVVDGVKMVK